MCFERVLTLINFERVLIEHLSSSFLGVMSKEIRARDFVNFWDFNFYS